MQNIYVYISVWPGNSRVVISDKLRKIVTKSSSSLTNSLGGGGRRREKSCRHIVKVTKFKLRVGIGIGGHETK